MNINATLARVSWYGSDLSKQSFPSVGNYFGFFSFSFFTFASDWRLHPLLLSSGPPGGSCLDPSGAPPLRVHSPRHLLPSPKQGGPPEAVVEPVGPWHGAAGAPLVGVGWCCLELCSCTNASLERHGSVGARPEKGHKSDPHNGTPLLWKQVERAGVVQPGEKALGRPESGLSVSKGGL